jgi:hypothetical protein
MELEQWREAQAEATAATAAIRDALRAYGVPEKVYAHIQPQVGAGWRSYVNLGLLRADTALLVAKVLESSLPRSLEGATRWLDTGSGPGAMIPVCGQSRPLGEVKASPGGPDEPEKCAGDR